MANHEKDDWIEGEKTEDVVAFLDRLYTAKRKVEERIVVLGGGEDISSVCNNRIILTCFNLITHRESLFKKPVPS